MSTLLLDNVSRWFGNVVAVNDVTMTIGPGVTGLLGPNGAGKSTLIHMMGGFLAPSSGTVTLDGEVVWRNEEIYRRIGLVPEREAMYDVVTGWEFVLANAKLHRLPDPEAAARRALETVQMTEAQGRDISTYSKGMKQRVKMATALVHDPPVLLLDEPFNGMDPRQRLQLMDLLRAMGDEGRTVLFSSHILEEVEQIAGSIQVMVAGTARGLRWLPRDPAADDRAAAPVHDPVGRRPRARRGHHRRTERVGCAARGGARHRGSGLGDASTGRRDGSSALHVQATDFASFVRVLPQLASRHNIRLYEVTPADESLESVFSYLVAR